MRARAAAAPEATRGHRSDSVPGVVALLDQHRHMMSRPTRVGILTPTLSRSGGGIFPIVAAHARGLAAEPGMGLRVFGIPDEFGRDDVRALDPVHPRSYRPVIRK